MTGRPPPFLCAVRTIIWVGLSPVPTPRAIGAVSASIRITGGVGIAIRASARIERTLIFERWTLDFRVAKPTGVRIIRADAERRIAPIVLGHLVIVVREDLRVGSPGRHDHGRACPTVPGRQRRRRGPLPRSRGRIPGPSAPPNECAERGSECKDDENAVRFLRLSTHGYLHATTLWGRWPAKSAIVSGLRPPTGRFTQKSLFMDRLSAIRCAGLTPIESAKRTDQADATPR